MGACSSKGVAEGVPAIASLPIGTRAPSIVDEDDPMITPRVSMSIPVPQPPPPLPDATPAVVAAVRSVLLERVKGAAAYALCSFERECHAELSVAAGDFLTILPESSVDEPVPAGWCRCRSSDGRCGLVPWSHLVSAAHAALDAATTECPVPPLEPSCTPPEGLSRVEQIERGARVRRVRREVVVRLGSHGQLGIDVNERNVVKRLLPGSHAAADGLLSVGDEIVAVNGRRLRGRLVKQALGKLMAESQMAEATSLRFTVKAETWEYRATDEQAMMLAAPLASEAGKKDEEATPPAAAAAVGMKRVCVAGPTPPARTAFPKTPLKSILVTPGTTPRRALLQSGGGLSGNGIHSLKSWSVRWAFDEIAHHENDENDENGDASALGQHVNQQAPAGDGLASPWPSGGAAAKRRRPKATPMPGARAARVPLMETRSPLASNGSCSGDDDAGDAGDHGDLADAAECDTRTFELHASGHGRGNGGRSDGSLGDGSRGDGSRGDGSRGDLAVDNARIEAILLSAYQRGGDGGRTLPPIRSVYKQRGDGGGASAAPHAADSAASDTTARATCDAACSATCDDVAHLVHSARASVPWGSSAIEMEGEHTSGSHAPQDNHTVPPAGGTMRALQNTLPLATEPLRSPDTGASVRTVSCQLLDRFDAAIDAAIDEMGGAAVGATLPSWLRETVRDRLERGDEIGEPTQADTRRHIDPSAPPPAAADADDMEQSASAATTTAAGAPLRLASARSNETVAAAGDAPTAAAASMLLLPGLRTAAAPSAAPLFSAAPPAGGGGWASHRHPPKPGDHVTTMRIEDMLRRAMAAAESDPSLTSAFDEMLTRYQHHPGSVFLKWTQTLLSPPPPPSMALPLSLSLFLPSPLSPFSSLALSRLPISSLSCAL